ncbi:MAG: cytoplasmic protein [Desulfovibrio sp.]
MEKIALFAFNGEMMCFVHVLLNGLDLHERGHEALIVFEGTAVKLAPELVRESNPFHALFVKAREAGIIAGVCRACSSKLGVLAEVEATGLPLLGDMLGHPSMGGYMEKGFRIITF